MTNKTNLRMAVMTLFSIFMLMNGVISFAQEPKVIPPEGAKSLVREQQIDTGPKVGEMAPTFKLKSLDGKTETDLSTFKGKMPVVLFFGSYT